MKNAITVVDQGLIDHFDSMLESEAAEFQVDRDYIYDLNQMAKDLIEINAELTKREQKIKSEVLNSEDARDSIALISNLLKGDGDEL